jgi:hypothetical protein
MRRMDMPRLDDMTGAGCTGTQTLRQASAAFSDGRGAYSGGQTCDWLIAPYSPVRAHNTNLPYLPPPWLAPLYRALGHPPQGLVTWGEGSRVLSD